LLGSSSANGKIVVVDTSRSGEKARLAAAVTDTVESSLKARRLELEVSVSGGVIRDHSSSATRLVGTLGRSGHDRLSTNGEVVGVGRDSSQVTIHATGVSDTIQTAI